MKSRKRRNLSVGIRTVRTRFAIAGRFMAPLRRLLGAYWPVQATHSRRVSSLNMAVSYMLRDCIEGDFPDIRINFERLQFSRGSLLMPVKAAAQTIEREMVVRWEITPVGTLTPKRVAQFDTLVVIYNEEQKLFLVKRDVKVVTGESRISLSRFFENCHLHVYFFVCDPVYSNASRTEYLGCVYHTKPVEEGETHLVG